MDNLQSAPGAPESTQPAIPTPAPAPTIQVPADGGGEKKMLLWIVMGIVATVLIVGGIYLALSMRQAQTKPAKTVPQVADPSSLSNLEKDASEINVSPPDSEFKEVDSDLGSL